MVCAHGQRYGRDQDVVRGVGVEGTTVLVASVGDS